MALSVFPVHKLAESFMKRGLQMLRAELSPSLLYRAEALYGVHTAPRMVSMLSCFNSARNAERFPAFHQLDIRVDKKFPFKKWAVNLYLDIQNAYNFKAKEQDLVSPVKDVNGNYLMENNGTSYVLASTPSTSGTIIPTFGIIIDF